MRALNYQVRLVEKHMKLNASLKIWRRMGHRGEFVI